MIQTLLKRPLLLWVVYLLAVMAVVLTFKAIFPEVRSGAAGLSGVQLLGQATLLLLPLPFVLALGWRTAGFNRPAEWKNLHLVAFPLFSVAFAYLAGFQNVDVTHVLMAVTLVILVALGEEAAFRGVLLKALLPRGTWYAVGVSSLLFGLMHLPNMLLGAPPVGVALQIVFAGLGGVGFAALRLRTNSLWPPVLIHALYDLGFRVADIVPGTAHANAYYMLHSVGFLIMALIILRPAQRARLSPALA